jgi:2-haloacid dehalogenase
MKSPLITTVVFDFGGVLLDWDPHNLYRSFFDHDDQIDQFLAEINFSAWNMQQDEGRPFSQGVAELSAVFPQYSHLIRAYRENWEDSIVGPIDGSVTILRRLKNAGCIIYGLSNWSAETFPLAYKKYDFFNLFDGMIISGEVKMVKPDPAIFELLLRRLNRPANECLLIDDSPTNVAAAQKMGFNVVLFRSPERLEDELQKFKLIPAIESSSI